MYDGQYWSSREVTNSGFVKKKREVADFRSFFWNGIQISDISKSLTGMELNVRNDKTAPLHFQIRIFKTSYGFVQGFMGPLNFFGH